MDLKYSSMQWMGFLQVHGLIYVATFLLVGLTTGDVRTNSKLQKNLDKRQTQRGNHPCPSIMPNTCANRRCYSSQMLCDGKDDCGDGSDEWDCDILDRMSKASGSDEIAWPWWILILSAIFVILTCLAVVCRYLRERTDSSLDDYLLDSPPQRRRRRRGQHQRQTTNTTSSNGLVNSGQIEMTDPTERSKNSSRHPQGRQGSHQVPPPIPPPPRLAQNPAQSTLVSEAVIASPTQHLNAAVAVDIEPLPPPPQPTRSAPPVPHSPPAPAPTATIQDGRNKRRSRRSKTPENLIEVPNPPNKKVRSRPEPAARNQPSTSDIPTVPPPPTTPRQQRGQQQQQAQQQEGQSGPQPHTSQNTDASGPPPAYDDLHFDGYRTLQVDQSSAAARGEDRPARQ